MLDFDVISAHIDELTSDLAQVKRDVANGARKFQTAPRTFVTVDERLYQINKALKYWEGLATEARGW